MTRPRLVVILALLGVNLAVFLAYTLPRELMEQSLASRLTTLRAEVDRDRRLTAYLKDRADTIRSNTKDTERFYKELIRTPKESLLHTIQDVESTAAELGLATKGVTFAPDDIKELGVVRLQIAMPVSGPYRQIVAFLDRLEKSPRFLVVDQVQLRMRTDGGGDLTFGLSAYFRAETGETHGT